MGWSGRMVYIVTEFCGDQSLNDLFGRSPLDEKSAMNVILPVLDALETAHNQGILHCDVNPSNIHLKTPDHPILLDFGSARFLDDARNSHRLLTCNPGYSAPEQHSQRLSDYKPWTDIYSCAATLYQLTTGKRLPAADLRRGRNLSVPTGLTGSLADALSRALSLDPYDRPSSIAEFRSDLTSLSPGATIYQPGPHTTQGRRVQKFVLDRLPIILILFIVLGAAVFVYSAKDPGPFPAYTKTALLVNPSDYYVLRDASSSIDDRYYDLVEDILRGSVRTTGDSNANADYTSYAHFASWATNGTSLLQPAVRGDIIDETKKRLLEERKAEPSDEFARKTDFSVLFRQIHAAIKLSRTGVRQSRRAAIVAIITDGVHDHIGNRQSCLNVIEDQTYFFDSIAREKFKLLAREPNVHMFIFLLGAPPECAGGIEPIWVDLARAFNRVKIVSLEGYSQSRGPQDETLRRDFDNVINAALGGIQRASFLAIRPAANMLSDKQRESFDNGGVFYVDFIFQPHLCDRVSLRISQASLLGAKGSFVAPLSVTNKSEFLIFSEDSPRNGRESKETLAFEIASNFKPDPNQAYQIHLSVEAEAARVVTARTEGDIKIEPSAKSRLRRERVRRLGALTLFSGVVSIIFSCSLLTYWKQGFLMRYGRMRRLIRNMFIKPLRYWLLGFFALGSLMLISLGAMISSAGLSSFSASSAESVGEVWFG